MHDCILRLLRSTSDHESLECFCRLITTTGKELDHPQAKVEFVIAIVSIVFDKIQ